MRNGSYALPLLVIGCFGLGGTITVSTMLEGRQAVEAERRAQLESAPSKPSIAPAPGPRVESPTAPQPVAAGQLAVTTDGKLDACQAEFDKALAASPIDFQHGEAALSAKGKTALDGLTMIARACSSMKIEIGAYTDSLGKRPNNLRLSQKRADTVKNYLVEQGLSADRLTAVGFGPDHPVASDQSEEGREKNRRIAFRVVRVESG